MWELLLDWPEVARRGYDTLFYLVLAGVGTLFFLIRLGFAMVGGDDGSDFDTDGGFDSDVAFSVFSVLSILAFFMGAGWMGLACRLDWGLGRLASSFIATGFGVSMMVAAAGLSYATRRLSRTIEYDLRTAIGRTGRVYLTVPAKGEGLGQVEISVSGRRKVLPASSAAGRLEAFSDVRVLDVRDDETLVVEPLS